MAQFKKHYVHRYESVREFALDADKRKNTRAGASQRGDKHWTGTSTFMEARDMAIQGWSDARPKVDAVLEPLREKLAEVLDWNHERLHDITGYEPDVDRFLAGEFECMWEDVTIEAPKQGKVFTLLVSNCVNSHVSAETIFKRGAAIAALIEAFQMLQCDVEIWVETSVSNSWYSGDKSECYSTLVRVHEAGVNVDVNNVMFPVGHPSWLRRLFFAHIEGAPSDQLRTFGVPDGGYGQAFDTPMCDEMVGASIVLSMGANQDWNDKDPVAWVLDKLELQGVWSPEDGV